MKKTRKPSKQKLHFAAPATKSGCICIMVSAGIILALIIVFAVKCG